MLKSLIKLGDLPSPGERIRALQRYFLRSSWESAESLLEYLPRCIVANFLLTGGELGVEYNGLPLDQVGSVSYKKAYTTREYIDEVLFSEEETIEEIEHGVLRFLVPVAMRVNLQFAFCHEVTTIVKCPAIIE